MRMGGGILTGSAQSFSWPYSPRQRAPPREFAGDHFLKKWKPGQCTASSAGCPASPVVTGREFSSTSSAVESSELVVAGTVSTMLYKLSLTVLRVGLKHYPPALPAEDRPIERESTAAEPTIGHNSVNAIDRDRLHNLVERIEFVEADRAELAEDTAACTPSQVPRLRRHGATSSQPPPPAEQGRARRAAGAGG
jgi:hypothetical protein